MKDEKAHSVPQDRKHTSVIASPLNEVKFELGVVLVLAVVLLVIIPAIEPDSTWQLMYLFGFGLISMFWLIYRVRRVVRLHNQNSGDESS